jgi:hypothetical protein
VSNILEKYIKSLRKVNNQDATELTYRSQLEVFLNEYTDKYFSKKKINIIHEATRIKKKGPDFQIKIDDALLGIIETKELNSTLEKVLETEQIKDNYPKISKNILLTNYQDFILIKDGNIFKVKSENLKNNFNEYNKNLFELLEIFFSSKPTKITDLKYLIDHLSSETRFLKKSFIDVLEIEKLKKTQGEFWGLYYQFKESVYQELTLKEFGDSFAQMVTYSVFIAKIKAKDNLINLENLKDYILPSFSLIRELVQFFDKIRTNKSYSKLLSIINQIISIINNVDIDEITKKISFSKKTVEEDQNYEKYIYSLDPYLYFYEYFLRGYDKKSKIDKGVFYTPPPVVSFICKATNHLLSKNFNQTFSNEDVKTLDFASGTGTFLLEVTKLIINSTKNGVSRINKIQNHILKNLYGFEILIAPYTISHLKLSQYLSSINYNLRDQDKFQIILTNTLENKQSKKYYILPSLTNESVNAERVKNEDILVILGNPPYNVKSKNNGVWIKKLIDDYRKITKNPNDNSAEWENLGERNPKNLQDDYVKFIRFAHNKVLNNKSGGIISVITNSRFIDNPTFRGMRSRLMKDFDQIYLLNLNGSSSSRGENISPSGKKDENIFDINQSVCISFFIKNKNNFKKKEIFYSEVWGDRFKKYQYLQDTNFEKVKWKKINPIYPNYYFTSLDTKDTEQYDEGKSIKDIFKESVTGIKTSRDNLVIDFNKEKLIEKIYKFLMYKDSYKNLCKEFDISEVKGWNYEQAKKEIDKSNIDNYIKDLCFRPFDIRKIFYAESLIDRHRGRIMKSLIDKGNLALITGRSTNKKNIVNHFLVTDCMAEIKSSESTKGSHVFPLKIKSDNKSADNELFAQDEYNFQTDFIEYVNNKYSKKIHPELIFYYIYGLLNSRNYLRKYKEQLRLDFPKIYFRKKEKEFLRISELGKKLTQIQLNKNCNSENFFQGNDLKFIKKKYEIVNEKLFINETSFFIVNNDTAKFEIGGYKILEKYINSREDFLNESKSISEINNLIYRINETINIQKIIDDEFNF